MWRIESVKPTRTLQGVLPHTHYILRCTFHLTAFLVLTSSGLLAPRGWAQPTVSGPPKLSLPPPLPQRAVSREHVQGPMPAATEALWRELLQNIKPAADTQKSVLRALSSEVGARPVPQVPPGGLLKWLEDNTAHVSSQTERWEVMLDQLAVARLLLRSEQKAEQRRSLRAALSALNLARRDNDVLLCAAIVEGFMLPYLDIADIGGSLDRFALLGPLATRFRLLPGKETDESDNIVRLPFPPHQAALSFLRLQIALAPDALSSAWPRAHLVQRLLRTTPDDETPQERVARLREARDALRGIVPGDGASVFRARLPEIDRALNEPIGADAYEEWNSPQRTAQGVGGAPQAREAYAALMQLLTNTEENRRTVLNDVARLGGLSIAAQASAVRRRTPDEWRKLDADYRLWLEKPHSNKEIYGRLYGVLASMDATVNNPACSLAEKQAALSVVWWAMSLEYNIIRDTEFYVLIDSRLYTPTHDNVRSRIYEAWFHPHFYDLDESPVLSRDTGPGRYYMMRGGFRTWVISYPIRRSNIEAFAAALAPQKGVGQSVEQVVNAVYNPVGIVYCAKARAAIDLAACGVTQRDHWEDIVVFLSRTLEGQDRYEDAMLALSLLPDPPAVVPTENLGPNGDSKAMFQKALFLADRDVHKVLLARYRDTILRVN